MGTLTADIQRLPGNCDHKLPTSCRLTSIPLCCACADERAHSPSYSTYIDGIGFVPRGTRWQRYCWFCKEFWENRVAATNLRPTQTRIPHVPDQTDFLAKWYEFHRGYRVVTREDGPEEHVAVLGEPFEDVSPGHLPRTLDELRAGRETSAAEQHQHVEVEEVNVEGGPSLEDTLDQMFEAASAEEAVPQTRPSIASAPRSLAHIAGQVMQPAASRNREYQNRRIASLRRELQRMRHGVERVIAGLRELGEAVPDSTEATGQLAQLDRSLDRILGDDIPWTSDAPVAQTPSAQTGPMSTQERGLESLQRRRRDADARLEEAVVARDDAANKLRLVEQHVTLARTAHEDALASMSSAEAEVRHRRHQSNQLQREQRTTENYIRLFGTREDMERQGAEYESPIGGMFTRAWDRFRVAEETRQEERALRQVLEDETRLQDTLRQSNWSLREGQDLLPLDQDTPQEGALNEYYAMLRQLDSTQQTAPAASQDTNFPSSMLDAVRGLDNDERRTRIQHLASLDAHRVVAEAVQDATTVPEPTNVLERLLQNTAEAERIAIVERMTENGTAQVLQQLPSDPLDFYRRLRGSEMPAAEFADSETSSEDGHQGLDVDDDGRPEPRNEEEMVLKMDCKVCYTQMADTACLPCGHLVMCQWCSEQHSPVMEHDKTRPRRPANCPVCRKRIKQKVRIYRA